MKNQMFHSFPKNQHKIERTLTNSNIVNLPNMGLNFFPTSDLNTSGSGTAKKRIAVFIADRLLPNWELDAGRAVGSVDEGAEELGEP